MTTSTSTPPLPSHRASRSPGAGLLGRLNIGRKLTVGFGILVLLTLATIALSVLGSNSATREINRTSEVRAPIALAAARAHASLLRMVGDMRGYLALGDKALRDDYLAAQQEFEQNLRELEERSPSNGAPIQGLDTLQQQYAAWQQLPAQLLDLHDDQLQREPALRMLIKEGSPQIVQISQSIKLLIDARAQGDQTAEGVALIKDLASFQGSFTAMISGLRGWVTTQRTAFYTEYISNSIINEEAWRKLLRAHAGMPPDQQKLLDTIGQRRKTLLPLADQIISTAAGEHVREDLFQFREQAVPPANAMLATLSTITREQQDLLKSDLQNGSDDLLRARQQTLVAGAAIALIALALSFIFRANIAGPIRRLTRVAEQIHGGDLAVEAQVESRDEIGRLAATFNRMTGQLRQTLTQVRKEKKRADDLLDVVIPIGVALSSEKDFNRLLEKIVLEAKAFCNANAGILYLRTDDDQLKYMIVRNDLRNSAFGGTSGNPILFAPLPLYDQESRAPNHRSVTAHAALTGSSINIPNAYAATEFDINVPQDFDDQSGYPSLLTIPLKNGAGEVIGVLQLLDALDPQTSQAIPFDANLQRLIESLSSLAVAALEAYVREQSLRHEIRQLQIEIDDVKRQQQVEAIVETDFFQNLRAKAQAMRSRNRGADRPGAAEETVPPAASAADELEIPQVRVE
ncbi:MAG: HAMP domain-containing protein [Roseiflexaceae bacterium]